MLRLFLLLFFLGTGVSQAYAAGLDRTQKTGFELFRAERYQEALPYFQQALGTAEARYGADDPRIAVELNNLGEVYRLLGQLEKAEPLYERALALVEDSKGDEDPGLATSLNNLALLYREQGRLAEAEQLYERSLDILEEVLGPGHPNVAKSMNNLAMLYDLQGERDRARPMIERAHEVARNTLGPDHPTTITLAANMERLASAPAPVPAPAPDRRRTAAATPATTEPVTVEPAAGRPEKADAPTAPPTDGAFAIHLASVRSAESAKREWQRLSDELNLPGSWQAMPPERVEVEGKGTFYRVTGGAFASRTEAVKACATIKAEGAYCGVLQR